MLFQFIAACSCDVVVLFMICVNGEIIIHAQDISNDVYQLVWYQFDPKSKYTVWIMIARTQQPYYFASFKTVNCSLETFINVKCLDSFQLLFAQLKFIFFLLLDYSESRRCTCDATEYIMGYSEF